MHSMESGQDFVWTCECLATVCWNGDCQQSIIQGGESCCTTRQIRPCSSTLMEERAAVSWALARCRNGLVSHQCQACLPLPPALCLCLPHKTSRPGQDSRLKRHPHTRRARPLPRSPSPPIPRYGLTMPPHVALPRWLEVSHATGGVYFSPYASGLWAGNFVYFEV